MLENIHIEGRKIAIKSVHDHDYISLSDMAGDGSQGKDRIQNWIRNRDTIDFLKAWEELNNPNFNGVQMHTITEDVGRNRFLMSPKKWIENTNAIGLLSKAGRYGGVYGHSDIAFHFGMWIEAKFALLVIREFQRLKSQEYQIQKLEWSTARFLSKTNYQFQTEAIKENILPRLNPSDDRFVYATEADILNQIIFGMTAKQWRDQNPASKGNIRDNADLNQLTILSNLESFNSELIRKGASKEARAIALSEMAGFQSKVLNQKYLPE